MATGRRGFLRSLSVIGTASLAGCAAGRRALDEFDIDDDQSGVRDTDGDGVIDSEDYAPRDPEVQRKRDLVTPASTPAATASPTPTPGGTPTPRPIITERFEDGSYTDTFTVREQDDETIDVRNGRLLHESPKNYNEGGRMVTAEFDATGTIRFRTVVKFDPTNYWGYGMGFRFDDARAWIKEQKWGEENRLKAVVKGENVSSRTTTIGPPTSSSAWQPYSLTIDFDDQRMISARRGDTTTNLSLGISDAYSDTVRVFIGGGRGHRVLHEYVSVHRAR